MSEKVLNGTEGLDLVKEIEKILGFRIKRREREKIIAAYEFAFTHHRSQFRDSGEPFIIHPVAVSKILAELRADLATIIAGLLHDIVEDCEVSIDEVREKFGNDVANIVNGVTKISNLNLTQKLDKKEAKFKMKVETIRKMLFAMSDDPRVIIVKLADRLHNMRTIQHLKDDTKRKEKANETLKIYAPIAHRIGIHKIKWELEDISFKTLYPEQYRELKLMMNRKLQERQSIMDEYRRIVTSELRKYRINFRIEGRVKHLYSIWTKMTRKNKAFDEIYDLIALRIITESDVDCYKILGIVHSLWAPIPGRIKDYIATPKSNGYRSLHTTLVTHNGEPLEIQIRSETMHREAEYGVAAHWLYKEGISSMRKNPWFEKLRKDEALISSFEDLSALSKMLSGGDEIYVFTPKGDFIHLPKGATSIDFAYAIHTEIGHHFAGAKVNDRIVPIDYELKAGDRVEIIVNKASEGPSLDWLKYAKSSSTRAKIRRFFKNKTNAEFMERGRDICKKLCKRLGKSVDEFLESDTMERVLKKFNINSEKDLFFKLGEGSITTSELLKTIQPEEEESKLPEVSRVKIKPGKGKEVLIGGQTGIDVYFAKCCNPVPGDDIVAIISKRGISIHNAKCKNVRNVPLEKQLSAEWSLSLNDMYRVKVIVDFDASDRSVISKVIDKFKVKGAKVIKYTVESGKWGYDFMDANILVKDLGHLTSIMESLRSIKGVQRVIRVGGAI
ncbi:MAG: bifunctional (p)ppGpp synthetase/guanosine-3',5'-bis(diphosphate) 3'-pyrophosphohydrolase [Kosmotoga sp.]|uniref:RelA/SpoT family protein n=1 Tax=Kosmotoga sp. TaxID=1955248 RepID=UPI001DA66BAA|nr:bifunctional (p)ppGpp synthetase/guanosine-3',5'-bis(diphosphate) 3'-pyrophosphohydrolase [Kosmotoga sp.]MBO8166065.1 bifunctional (p)ppGpp synthetase/guanosine-3',5'-bis(diphosphate) 3'-pyrophosphohydrolase [Kosmotoga sp.]